MCCKNVIIRATVVTINVVTINVASKNFEKVLLEKMLFQQTFSEQNSVKNVNKTKFYDKCAQNKGCYIKFGYDKRC